MARSFPARSWALFAAGVVVATGATAYLVRRAARRRGGTGAARAGESARVTEVLASVAAPVTGENGQRLDSSPSLATPTARQGGSPVDPRYADVVEVRASIAKGAPTPAEAPSRGRVLSRFGWAFVAIWLVYVAYAATYLAPTVASSDISLYVLQPLLWSSVGAFALWLWRLGGGEPFPVARWPIAAAVLAALLQVALIVLAGLLVGFGESPYARSPQLIALNLWFVGTRLAGMELARWYIVSTLGRRNALLGLGVGWLLLWLVAVPLPDLATVRETEAASRFVGLSLLPAAGESFLASYLVLVGGPLASLAYRGTLAAFEWLSPVLPDLSWTLAASLGTVAPVLGLGGILRLLEWRAARRGRQAPELGSPGSP